VPFFLRKTAGEIPTALQDFYIKKQKQKTVQMERKHLQQVQGGRKDKKKMSRTKQLYLAIEQFGGGNNPSLLRAEGDLTCHYLAY